MKVLWLKGSIPKYFRMCLTLFLILSVTLSHAGLFSQKNKKDKAVSSRPNRSSEQPLVPLISRKKALVIAERTEEVNQFYDLGGGRYFNCIEKEVVRPCETDWVTCVDNAWVVKFNLGDRCGVKHDGRLSVTLLINNQDGSIISRFPEKEYFIHKPYCMIDDDCLLYTNQKKQVGCKNFIFGQLGKKETYESELIDCVCKNDQCVLRK